MRGEVCLSLTGVVTTVVGLYEARHTSNSMDASSAAGGAGGGDGVADILFFDADCDRDRGLVMIHGWLGESKWEGVGTYGQTVVRESQS